MLFCLEWKYVRMFVLKGNKRLICLVDDFNFSRVSVDIDLYNFVIKKEEFGVSVFLLWLVGWFLGIKKLRSYFFVSNVFISEWEIFVFLDVFLFLK